MTKIFSLVAFINRKGITHTKRKTTSQLIAESRRAGNSSNSSSKSDERKSWLDTVDYYTEEEKFFKIITATIGKKEHLPPSAVEEWCLPDIVLLFSMYIDDVEQMKSISEEIEKSIDKK